MDGHLGSADHAGFALISAAFIAARTAEIILIAAKKAHLKHTLRQDAAAYHTFIRFLMKFETTLLNYTRDTNVIWS